MDMKVWHGLLTVISAIHDQSVALLEAEFLGDVAGDEKEMAESGLILDLDFAHRDDRFARHDQEMHRCLRIDVVEDSAEFILVDDLARNLTVEDLLKQRFLVSHDLLPRELPRSCRAPRVRSTRA